MKLELEFDAEREEGMSCSKDAIADEVAVLIESISPIITDTHQDGWAMKSVDYVGSQRGKPLKFAIDFDVPIDSELDEGEMDIIFQEIETNLDMESVPVQSEISDSESYYTITIVRNIWEV